MSNTANTDSRKLSLLKRRITELEAENSHLRRLYDKARLSYQPLDENGCFVEVNQACLDILRYSREEVIDKIIDPYFTTKGIGEGTGVGLATAKGIVDGHGGHITVSSIPNYGATFVIHLPLAANAERDTTSTEAASRRGSEHSLYIYDEPAIVNMGRRMLERLDYTVTSMTDSLEALDLFKKIRTVNKRR